MSLECAECVLSQTGFHFYITHWDLDGVVSAALLVHTSRRLGLSYDYRLATPGSLTRFLREAPAQSRLVIADIALRPRDVPVAKQILSRMEKTIWIDHHEWPQQVVEELKDAGVLVLLDPSPSTSASLLVHHYLSNCCGIGLDDYDWLVQLAHQEDHESEATGEARKWRIVLRMSGWELRYRIVDSLAEKPEWPSWLTPIYDRLARDYSRILKEALRRTIVVRSSCLTIAAASAPNQLHPGDVHAGLARQIEADIYVIMYPSGVSLRSTVVDVNKLAERLGGGGHAYAAGAPLQQGYEPQKLLDSIVELVEEQYCRGASTGENSPGAAVA